jgi:hypothetical protein
MAWQADDDDDEDDDNGALSFPSAFSECVFRVRFPSAFSESE